MVERSTPQLGKVSKRMIYTTTPDPVLSAVQLAEVTRKSRKVREVEDRLGERIEDLLVELYDKKQYSLGEVSSYLRLTNKRIKRYLEELSIPIRTKCETRYLYWQQWRNKRSSNQKKKAVEKLQYAQASKLSAVEKLQEIHKVLWTKPEMMASLKSYEKDIITRRFLHEGPIPTLADVARSRNVSAEWARTCENRVIDVFRQQVKGEQNR